MEVGIVMFGTQHCEEVVQVFLLGRIFLPGACCFAECRDERDGAGDYDSGHPRFWTIKISRYVSQTASHVTVARNRRRPRPRLLQIYNVLYGVHWSAF
jgi:hypothetical protein